MKEIELVKFTHHNTAVLCATKKEPYEILYWSLHENEVIRKFLGHTNPITCLEMNPKDDRFLTCS